MRLGLGFALATAALVLAACSTTPAPPPISPAPPPATTPAEPVPPPTPYVTRGDFRGPPGWESEDHAEALRAFATGCGASKDQALLTCLSN